MNGWCCVASFWQNSIAENFPPITPGHQSLQEYKIKKPATTTNDDKTEKGFNGTLRFLLPKQKDKK